MRKLIGIAIPVIALISAILIILGAAVFSDSGGTSNSKLLNDFTGAAKDSLNPEDLKKLSGSISKMYEKYKFNDKDIEELCTSSINLVLSMSTFTDALNSSTNGNVDVPKADVKDFFTSLSSFLGKYKVTAEDALSLGRDVAQVAMGAQQKLQGEASGNKSSLSRENMDKIFTRLIDFSKKHNIQAEDLVPIMNNLADIGLTVAKEQALGKIGKLDPGVNKSQIMSLIGSLMTFQKKYRIDLFEIIQLGDEIRKITSK